MKKALSVAVLAALMSAGAWTCQATVIFKESPGGGYNDSYWVCEYLTEYLHHSVFSVEVYNQLSDGSYLHSFSGIMTYDAVNKIIQVLGFESDWGAYSRSMIGQWNGSSVTMYYCLADGYFDNTTLTLYSE